MGKVLSGMRRMIFSKQKNAWIADNHHFPCIFLLFFHAAMLILLPGTAGTEGISVGFMLVLYRRLMLISFMRRGAHHRPFFIWISTIIIPAREPGFQTPVCFLQAAFQQGECFILCKLLDHNPAGIPGG